MSLYPPPCTCALREHACSPPCRAHPELGGGLGNPGITLRNPALELEEFFDGPIEITSIETGFSYDDTSTGHAAGTRSDSAQRR